MREVQYMVTSWNTITFECAPEQGSEKILKVIEFDFATTKEEQGFSINSRKFLAILEETYQLTLLQCHCRSRPAIGQGDTSKASSTAQIQATTKRFDREPQYATKQKAIDNIDAELVPKNEIDNDNCWYRPHFGGFNPKKSGTRYLNDYLPQEPD